MKQLRIIGVFILMLFLGPLCSQSLYGLDVNKESAIFGSGLLSLVTGLLLHMNTQPYIKEDIKSLNKSMVNRFDVGATYYLYSKAGRSSNILMISSHLAPVLFVAGKKTRTKFGQIALLYGETIIMIDGLTFLTKQLVKRPKPFVFNEHANLNRKLTRQANHAFFSEHASITSANYFFFAKVFSDCYPDSRLKPFVWGTAATIPALTGYLSIKSGNQYITDVITGYTAGTLVGFLIPHLHKVDKPKHIFLVPKKNKITFTYKF